jgi:hypothetical protein
VPEAYSMSNKQDTPVSRRDSLKLATAVTALAAGLGATLVSSEASAHKPFKVNKGNLGSFSVKLLKYLPGDKLQLVHTFDLGTMNLRTAALGSYSIKLFHTLPHVDPAVLVEQNVDLADKA